jgi:signal transduction histidine kinase
MADAATATEEKEPHLSHSSHEIRNSVSVILGYVRMLATERLGPLTDPQRKAVGEIATATAKLTDLAEELTKLSRLLVGNFTLVRTRVELGPLIAAEVPSVPPLPDREVSIRVIDNAASAAVNGDAGKLRTAFNSLMFSHRREVVSSRELCVAIDRVAGGQQSELRVTMGGSDQIEELRRLSVSELVPLVEFRGGVGFKLSMARCVIEGHGGQVLSKTEPGITAESPRILGAAIILPEV